MDDDCERSRSLESYPPAWDPRYIASGRPPQKTPLPLLLRVDSLLQRCLPHRCIATRAVRTTEKAACNTCSFVAWRHGIRDAFLCCVCTGHYLETTVSLPSQFLPWANTPQYYEKWLSRTFVAPNMSTFLQATSAADAHLAEEQYLREEQTSNNAKSPMYRTGSRRPAISEPKGQNLESRH
jgi:hypothetical protein